MKTSFVAVGHSNRTLAFLVGLVLGYEIERVVDVRTVPRSRHNPQFNRDSLPQNLRSVGIAYTLYRGAERRRGAGRRPCRERRFRHPSDISKVVHLVEQATSKRVSTTTLKRLVKKTIMSGNASQKLRRS